MIVAMEKRNITPAVGARLVAAQFPQWADLPVVPVALNGWDNTTFRLGDELCVRLPSADAYVAQVEKEHRWLPVLARQLPLPIPEPVAVGRPGGGFPRPWSLRQSGVSLWLPVGRERTRRSLIRTAVLRLPDERVSVSSSLTFLAVHLLALGALATGVTARSLVLCTATFWVRVFFITAGYHRYFSHRSYKLGRVTQFVMAFGGATACQRGVLWWAGHHRAHHRHADTDRDPHSPKKGFWWSHMGWILCDHADATAQRSIRDFARYPELRLLERYDWVPPWTLGVVCYLIAGWSGLFVGFFLSTVLLWHATFSVNSFAHVFGRRRYDTNDTSRNSLVVALLTGGEGWHNNHHHYPASARQGFYWWELDPTYYVLRLLCVVGVVRDLRTPPPRVRAGHRPRGATALSRR
jgi:stearoyl-CoA desaturase (Delta-9 desaturase)